MHLNLPTGKVLSLDFEPLTAMSKNEIYHIEEIVSQLNSDYDKAMVLDAAGGVILDLGANVGLWSLYLSSVAKTVYALEPSPEHYKILLDVLKATNTTNVVPLNQALWTANEVRQFCCNTTNRTADSFYAIGEHTTIGVSCIRLDRLMDDYDISEVSLVKMDIEGAEVDIIRDKYFGDSAKRIRTLCLECHNFRDWCSGSAVVDEMESILCKFFPNVRRAGTNTLIATRQ